MRLVVKLNGGQHSRVFCTNNEVVTQPIDSVVPFVELEALFDAKNSRHLHLRKNDVLRQRLDQAVVENLFWLRKWALCVEGPRTIAVAEKKSFLEDDEGYDCQK